MLESIFLLLALVAMVIVIIACIKGCKRNKTNENILKALIIATGVFIFLASIVGRLKL